MMRAFITGVTGQDGSLLADLLLSKGYEVYGLVRWSTVGDTNRHVNIQHILDSKNPNFHVVYGDITDSGRIRSLLDNILPDEVYNLAAQSHVGRSFQMPEQTAAVTGMGALSVLESIRSLPIRKSCRYYQASTSEMLGKVTETPQNERTRFHPRSPYGVAKTFAHHMTINYRESYGMYACCGIMFNHESERRGPDFVTRKITLAATNISKGRQQFLELGNLEAKRDWGYAPDYVEAMWMMLQQDQPKDYVVGTGVMHTVEDFAAAAFGQLGLFYDEYIRVNPDFIRPAEVDILCADSSLIRSELGWSPKTDFNQLVKRMVDYDCEHS